MPNKNAKVVSVAQKIATLMCSAGDRSDALDAHDMARTFYRRLSIPSRPQIAGLPQSKKRVLSASA